ncbi:MAG: hypothetical protein Q9225_002639 [Loekoesia sp. 1 TL-2023]
MGSHPRPHFFISRPDHSITPLIAVDELPDYVRINGVPATMTQADTQAMMSLGVKERSLGQYEVQVVELSRSSSCEGPAKSSDTSCSGRPSNSFDEAPPLESTAKQNKQTGDHTADSSSIEMIQRPDLEAGRETAAAANKAAHDGVEDKRSVDIEEWRRDVEVVEAVDDIQARIDNLVTANPQSNEKVKEDLGDENPRAAQAKAGLTPGKKVYCSHWIRTGECDFTQQGCLYKHEMPDDDTLKAIGIRALPAWYIAAHPAKAHERGYDRGNASGNRISKPQLNHFPGATFTSSRIDSRTQPQPFNQSPTFFFPQKPNTTFFYPSAGFAQNFTRPPLASDLHQRGPFPRFQELQDDRVSPWQIGDQTRGGQLQLTAKPPKLKSPGYNTYPYPLPAPPTTQPPATEKPQMSSAPVWEPRQSKYKNGSVRRQEHSESSQTQNSAVQRPDQADAVVDQIGANLCSRGPSAPIAQASELKAVADESSPNQSKVHNATVSNPSNPRIPAINALYVPLKPSPPSGPTLADLPSRGRSPSNSSDLFALAPKVPSPVHRRFFVRPGEERYVKAAKEPKASKEENSVLREEVDASKPKETAKTFRKQRHPPSNQDFERLKTGPAYDKTKRVLLPEKSLRTKRTEREHDQASERLVDY